MTVSSTTSRKTYLGDAVTTSFDTNPVAFFLTSDLLVYVVTTATGAATLLTENTHYTVSGGSGTTGTVSLAGGSSPYGALSALQTLVIVRAVPETQLVDFVNNEATDAEVAEDALDKLTMICQQLDASVGRAFALASTDVSGASTVIPTPSANKVIGWNSAGTALQNYAGSDISLTLVSSFISTLIDDVDAATARTTLDAQQEISSLTQDTNPDEGADFVLTRDVSASADKKVLISDMILGPTAGRLTLTTALPVTTADVTAAATVYWTPYRGEILRIYDGTRMVPYASAELSMALDSTGAHTGYHQSGKNFDVFAFNDAGTLRIGTGPAWTSDTARGTGAGTTELAVKNGLYTNNVSITLRFGSASGNTVAVAANKATYLGSFRTTADGQTEDSLAKRFLWNNYNRVRRTMRVLDTTDSWNYTTNGYRQANGSGSNQLAVLRGLDEESASVRVLSNFTNSAGATGAIAGIGLDVTNAISTGVMAVRTDSPAASNFAAPSAFYSGLPGLGYHFFARLENGLGAGGTTTWYGDNGGAVTQSGIDGEVTL